VRRAPHWNVGVSGCVNEAFVAVARKLSVLLDELWFKGQPYDRKAKRRCVLAGDMDSVDKLCARVQQDFGQSTVGDAAV